MLIPNLFKKKSAQFIKDPSFLHPVPKDQASYLHYNWIITNKLAVGPMPKTLAHWDQLQADGFSNRFSCCFPNEHIFAHIPPTWISREVSLPDHRAQVPLEPETLLLALREAEDMLLNLDGPLYLHCFAGQERSVLMAIGLLCIVERKNLFDSIAYVRQCHHNAKPLYSHLDLLEQTLKSGL